MPVLAPSSKKVWISSDIEKPIAFDLVLIKDAYGHIQPGWWTGAIWDYGKKHITGNVVLWTRSGVDN
jgi:hypothetical protein